MAAREKEKQKLRRRKQTLEIGARERLRAVVRYHRHGRETERAGLLLWSNKAFIDFARTAESEEWRVRE